MTTSQAIFEALTQNDKVGTLVGDAVYPINTKVTANGSRVLFQQIAGDPDTTHVGRSEVTLKIYQFACFASEYEDALAVRDAVIEALDGIPIATGESPTLQDEREDYDEGAELFRADADFIF